MEISLKTKSATKIRDIVHTPLCLLHGQEIKKGSDTNHTASEGKGGRWRFSEVYSTGLLVRNIEVGKSG